MVSRLPVRVYGREKDSREKFQEENEELYEAAFKAQFLSGLMMLRHICLGTEAAHIENALLATLESGDHTGDFGDKSKPALGTTQFTQAIISRMKG